MGLPVTLTEEIKERIRPLLHTLYNDSEDHMAISYKQDATIFWDYYHGRLPERNSVNGVEIIDRTCESMVRSALKDCVEVFCSNDNGDAVKFTPTDAQDANAALAATKLVNQVLRDNDGYNVLSMGFLEALVARTAFIKRYWGKDTISYPINMPDVPDQPTLNAIIQGWRDGGFKIEEKELDITTNDDGTLSVKGFYHGEFEKVKVELTPVEEILIERRARSIQDTIYLCHRRRVSKYELLNWGFEKAEIDELPVQEIQSSDFLNVQQARSDFRRYDDNIDGNGIGLYALNDSNGYNDQAALCWIKEHYLRTALIEPGKSPQLYQIIEAAEKIIRIELVNEIPFTALNPLPLPFQIFGDSLVDLTKDIQEGITFLKRGFIDHTNNAAHGRFTAITGAYDRRSLLDNRPGGVVEMDRPDAVNIMPQLPLSNGAQLLLDMYSGEAERRTGVSDTQSGNAANALETNRMSENAIDNMMQMANGRVRNMVRDLANGGIRDLFLAIYRLIKENAQHPIEVQTAYQIIPVDPKSLPDRSHITVHPALTSQEKNKQAAKIADAYQFIQAVDPQLMSVPNKAYIVSQYLQGRGLENIFDFVIPLDQYQPLQPDPKYMADVENTQADTQLKLAQAGDYSIKSQIAPEQFAFEQQKAADEKHREDYKLSYTQQESADKNINESNRNNVEAIKVANAHERHKDEHALRVAEFEHKATNDTVNQMLKGHELQQAKHTNVEVSA
ncbi:TPA: hypothetical protein SCS57_002038 [Enterobacter cloacae]|nr:hypothetical protein [Enterobacter cloacae]